MSDFSRRAALFTPYAAREALGGDLLQEEEVVWAGQPDPNILFTKADAFLVPFSLLWGGFSLLWEGWVIADLISGQTRSGNGGSLWFFVVLGALMAFAGLYFMFGRFIYKRLRKMRTYYVVTDQRVIELVTLRGRHLTSMPIAVLPTMEKAVNTAGVGTIRFGKSSRWQRDYSNTGMDLLGGSLKESVLSFYDIHDVDRVYELVGALRGAKTDPASGRTVQIPITGDP